MYMKKFEDFQVPTPDIILPYKLLYQLFDLPDVKIYGEDKFDFEIWKNIHDHVNLKVEKKLGKFVIIFRRVYNE